MILLTNQTHSDPFPDFWNGLLIEEHFLELSKWSFFVDCPALEENIAVPSEVVTRSSFKFLE